VIVGKGFDFPNQLFDYDTSKREIFLILIAEGQMEQQG
jgi:hypothetical protein